MFSQSDLLCVAKLLRKAAQTEIMPRFRRLGSGDVRAKSGALDLVTAADDAAENVITQGLLQAFPGCLVVGEEASAVDPSLLDHLAGAELAFTVDPVDGTSNYAAGLPLFGVMAGVVIHGQVVGAVILDPVVDSFSAALLGQGAWEEAADGSVRALRVAAPVAAGAMTGTISWRFMAPDVQARVLAGLQRFAQVWDFRCAAQHYRMLAAGHAHFAVYNKLMPWDHLPGVLLHREAGGYAARFDGSLYRPGMVDGGLICAPDFLGWTVVLDCLMGPPT